MKQTFEALDCVVGESCDQDLHRLKLSLSFSVNQVVGAVDGLPVLSVFRPSFFTDCSLRLCSDLGFSGLGASRFGSGRGGDGSHSGEV